jgi:hypothetical protein
MMVKQDELPPIYVEKSEFLLDMMAWFRKASTEQKVVVMRDGQVSLVIGGRMIGFDEEQE